MTSYKIRWKTASTFNEALAHVHNGCDGLIYKRKNATPEETEILAASVAGDRGCRAIDYCRNKAGARGMAALTNLSTIPLNALCVLCVHSNKIGVEGARRLASAMHSPHCVLTEIYLGNNDIKDEGAQLVAAALYTNRFARSLYLARNGMTDVGGRACADAIKVNPSIRVLQLKQSYRVGDGLNYISEAILQEVEETINDKVNQQREALRELLGKNGAPWMRSKLMVIGQGRAGKTATIRSLTCEEFDPNLASTLGASLTQTKAGAGMQGWSQLHDGGDLIGAFTRRFVTKRLVEDSCGTRVAREQEVEASATLLQRPQADCGNENESEETTQQTPAPVKETIKEKFEGIKLLYDKFDDYDLSFSIWDYGGQKVFYTLHHLFLTEFGVYLLVFDMSELLDRKEDALAYLKFWLNSTKLHAPAAPVILVGTRFDQVNTQSRLQLVNEALQSLMQDKFPQVVANQSSPKSTTTFFPIDNTNANGADEIRHQIESVAREAEYVNQKVALSWVKFIDMLLKDKKTKWMELGDVETIARECAITSPKEIEAMLSFFHEIGSVVHFTNTEALRGIVTLSPQWLVDSISKVIRDDKLHRFDPKKIEIYQLSTDVDLLFTKGLVTRDLLEFVWNNEQVQFMLDLMKHTLLLSDWEFAVSSCSEELYLVPSMLRADGVDTTSYEGKYAAVYDFCETFLPDGLFERLLCLCVAHSATVDGTKEPILNADSAVVWLDRASAVVLKLEDDKIRVHFSNSKKTHAAFRMINAMLHKVKAEVMNGRLNWDTTLLDKRKDKKWTLQAAKKKKLSPWFTTWRQSKEMGSVSAVAMFNIGVFDSL